MNEEIKAVRLLRDDTDPQMSVEEREALEILRRRGGDMWAIELIQISGTRPATLDALEKNGYITIHFPSM